MFSCRQDVNTIFFFHYWSKYWYTSWDIINKISINYITQDLFIAYKDANWICISEWDPHSYSWQKLKYWPKTTCHHWFSCMCAATTWWFILLFVCVLNSFTPAARVNWSPRAQRSCSCSSRSIGNPCSPSSPRRSLQTSPGNLLSCRQGRVKSLGPTGVKQNIMARAAFWQVLAL